MRIERFDVMTRAWQVYAAWVVGAGLTGASWGFVRGLGYLPTLWAAPIEGGILFGVPAAVVGLLPVALCWLVRRIRT